MILLFAFNCRVHCETKGMWCIRSNIVYLTSPSSNILLSVGHYEFCTLQWNLFICSSGDFQGKFCFMNLLLSLLLGQNSQALCLGLQWYVCCVPAFCPLWKPVKTWLPTVPPPVWPYKGLCTKDSFMSPYFSLKWNFQAPRKGNGLYKRSNVNSPLRVFHFLERNWKFAGTERRKIRWMTVKPST